MRRTIKITGLIISCLLLLAVISFICLIIFVNPNRFKPFIVEEVKSYTGRQLTLDGDLSWTLFPFLGVKLGHLELSNPPGFKQKTFAEIQGATIAVKMLPLMQGKIESDGVLLKGLKLYLIKNAKGETNWAHWKNADRSAISSSPSQSVSTSTTQTFSPLSILISGIDLTQSAISYVNEQTHQTWILDHIELHAKHMMAVKPFPIKLSFQIKGDEPNLNGKVTLTSNMSFNLDRSLYRFDNAELKAMLQQNGKKFDITIKSTVTADKAQEIINIDNLLTELENIKLTGKIQVTHFLTQPLTTGQMHVHPFDLQQTMQSFGKDSSALPNAKQLSGDLYFSIPKSFLLSTVRGNFQAADIIAAKIHLTQVDIQTRMQKGILTFAPITANLYQGTLNAQAKVLLKTIPDISINAKLNNVEAEPLLKDLEQQGKLSFSGTGNVDLQVKTTGTNSNTLLKNLNGTSRLSFNNGILKGVDVGYLVDSAYALAEKGAEQKFNNNNETPFGTLTATAIIHQGVVTNNDLLLTSPRLESKGNGTIDLVNQKIKYTVRTQVKQATSSNQKNDLRNLYGIPIPIYISGNLNNPNIQLDTNSLMKSIAAQQIQKVKNNIQEKVEKKIEEKIQDQIPKKAGELLNKFLGN